MCVVLLEVCRELKLSCLDLSDHPYAWMDFQGPSPLGYTIDMPRLMFSLNPICYWLRPKRDGLRDGEGLVDCDARAEDTPFRNI